MKLVLVHLSDVHLSVEKWPVNPILERTEKLLAALNSLFLSEVDGCVLLINGDLAYAGLDTEYDMATKLFGDIRTGLQAAFGADRVHTVMLPGNHDCNFKLDNDARRQLITDIDTKGFGDGSVADISTRVQDAFFTFAQKFQGHAAPASGIERIFAEHRFTFGNEDVVIRTLNTAWCSKMREQPGTLILPTSILKPKLGLDGSAQVVATSLHHPYNWLEPNNAREIRNLIEESSDLVLTGHEHNAETYSKTKHIGEHNQYIEAGPLQENGNPENSEFNVVVVDTALRTHVVHHFVWKDDLYETVNEPLERPFVRNNARLQGEYQINEQFATELNDADAPYLHPFKDTVFLDDIFIFPDVREYSASSKWGKATPKGPKDRSRGGGVKQANDDVPQTTRRTIRGRELIDHILRRHQVIIAAPDRAGKTALARTIFKDLWRNGTMPLFLNGDKINSKITATFDKHLEECFSRQYSSPKSANYWRLPKESRALIIDDYHKIPNVKVVREKLLAECQKRFGCIILLGGQSLRYQEIVASEAEAGALSEFSQCEVLGFGHKLRSQLIRKWFLMNRIGEIDDDVVDRQVAQIEKIISIILGRDLVPPFPSYILLIIQQMELRQPVDISAASYGKLYQAFLTACLAKRNADLETAFSYLSELAYTFFDKKTDHFDDRQAIEFHNLYVATYANPIEYTSYRDNLVAAGLLVYKNGLLRFRVKAAFYFFVAQYISSNWEVPKFRELVSGLCGKLYREDAANIILFLCHLNRDPLVLRGVIASATSSFQNYPETDLYNDLKFTGDLIARLDVPVLTDESPEKRRQEMLERKDLETEGDDPSDEMYAYKHEDETDEDSEARRQLAQLNGAIKTIQILGQITRSFAGSLKGDEKRELAEACFALGLRLLSFGFDTFNVTKEAFGKALQKRIKRNFPEVTEDKAAQVANSIVFMFVDMFTYGIVRHIANSIGVERLAMTFAEIRERKNTIAFRTLDAAIQLEHFANVPESVVLNLYDDVQGVLLMQSVVRHLTLDRLSYYQCPRDVRQRLCKKLGIVTDVAMLNPDHKRD